MTLSGQQQLESLAVQNEIKAAADSLRKGELVSFPTETVYGLGADAASVSAMERLYLAKGRPAKHPVIVHIASADDLSKWASEVPDEAYALAQTFWPGPLTMILKRAPHVLDQVTGGQDTVGLRIPRHPLALALLKEFQGGVAAPSANRFGRISPTTAEHVRNEFGNLIAHVLDGGACQVGIESTIVDLTGANPRILRPGMITREEIESRLARKVADRNSEEASAVRAPGTLKSHYAPETPLRVLPFAELLDVVQSHGSAGESLAVLSFREFSVKNGMISWVVLPSDAESCARVLYLKLREMDALNAKWILIEAAPEGSEWTAIRDRLKRAAHENS